MSDVIKYEFYKLHETDTIWKVRPIPDDRKTSDFLFSFDGKTIYSRLRDYWKNLTDEQRKLFDSHFPIDDTPWDI